MSSVRLGRRGLLATAVCLVLGAGLWPQLMPAPHDGVLHGSEGVASWTAESGCAERHPPGFDSLRGKRLEACPGCLGHLQQRMAPTAMETPSVSVVVTLRTPGVSGAFQHPALGGLPYRRGPPIL
ncbi:MAG: hypothetical protein R3234_02435 [Thermoanaerobaculia bacterium]|nr:hypothetical protein [Thermoanaerobaculia bacterium]